MISNNPNKNIYKKRILYTFGDVEILLHRNTPPSPIGGAVIAGLLKYQVFLLKLDAPNTHGTGYTKGLSPDPLN